MIRNPVTGNGILHIVGMLALMISFALIADQSADGQAGIEIEIKNGFVPQSLSILLDSQDITELAQISDTGVSINPLRRLYNGKYTLLLSYISAEGYNIRKRIELDDVKNGVFYDGSTGLAITLRGKLYDKNDINKQEHEVDAHLGHLGNWQSESWAGDTRVDVWLFDRGTNIDPLKDNRPEVIDYYASAIQNNDDNGFLAEIGYIQLHESQNTIAQLARRGAHANYEGERVSVDLFTVNSQQHLGSEGGAGIGDGDDDTIVGISTSWSPLMASDKSLKLRAIYSKGSEAGDSLGLLSNNTPSEGDVAALVLESSFTTLGLNIEVEFDQSRFDADTSDAIQKKDDNAYALRLQGDSGWINYSAAFEHIGTDYAVVANPLLQNDREYITLSADFDRGQHGFAISTQVEHDNLDNEPTRAQLNKSYLTAEYLYRKGRNFSSLVSLQNNRLDSEKEPATTDVRDSITDSVLGKINFVTGRWLNQFSFLVSDLDDNTATNNDSQILSLTLSTSLYSNTLMFTPSYSATETEFNSGQQTEQGIFSLHVRGKAYDDRLDYQLSGSFSDLSDNTTTDITSTYIVARSNWSLGHLQFMAEKLQHSIGLELEHFDTENDSAVTQEDSIVWLSYSISTGNKN